MFTTRTGRPVELRNLVRSFARICKDHGIRLIAVHAIRHTVATLLKALKVPPRDAQGPRVGSGSRELGLGGLSTPPAGLAPWPQFAR